MDGQSSRVVTLAALVVLSVALSAEAQEERFTRLTATENAYPFWSPDGSRIVFNREFDGTVEIVVMELGTAAGSGRR